MQDLKFLIVHWIFELWRRRWSVLGVAYAVGVVGALLAATAPDQFTSKSVIYVDTKSLLVRVIDRRADLLNPEEQVEQVRRLMYTDTMMRDLIRRSDLDLRVENKIQEERLIESLKNRLTFQRDRENFYSVEFTDRDPQVAQRVVSNLVNLFIEKNINRFSDNSESSIEFLQRDLELVSTQVDRINAEIADYERENAGELADMTTLTARFTSAKRDLRAQEALVRTQALQIDSLSAQLMATPEQIQTGVARSYVPPEVAQLQALRAQRAALLSRVTEAHPDVKFIDEQIAQARVLARSAGGQRGGDPIYSVNPVRVQIQSQIQSLELSRASSVAGVEEARVRMREIEALIIRQPEIRQRYDALRAERKRLLDRSEVMRSDLERAKLTIDANRTGVVELDVVEAAEAPARPSGPPRLILFAAAMILAIGAGVGAAFLRIQLSDTMPTTVHLRGAYEDLPILGSISSVEPRVSASARLAGIGAFAGAAGGFVTMFVGLIYLYEIALWRPDVDALRALLGT